MIVEKHARETLCAVELDAGDELHFTLRDGATRRLKLLNSRAGVIETNLDTPRAGHARGRTTLWMSCQLEIDGKPVTIVREVGTQRSFDAPRELFGMMVWFDTADALFEHLNDNHGGCRPSKTVRMAVWDARDRICPVLLHPWCPLPDGGIDIARDCYDGADCWCGPYFGADAHGGLDINHPAGTPIWAPLRFEDHFYFNTLAAGDNNNRWRGLHTWPDGSTWTLQVHHLIDLKVPEHAPIEAGAHYADGAGVLTGMYEHSHFVLKVTEPGHENPIALDPWLLFRQMYIDREITQARMPWDMPT
ncbi:MAG: hypothetical protein ACOC7R_01725 [Planctomycetota bacterium]